MFRCRFRFELLRFWLVCLTVILLSSCSKEEGESVVAQSVPGVEICVVFSPGALGDQGYADRVLTGLFLFDDQLASEDYDHVQLRYITAADDDIVHSELLRWNEQGTSPYSRQAYERRLLVLTDQKQLAYLADTPLSETDEVLVMNVIDEIFEQAPRADWLGSRLHLLNISAAESARKLCRLIDHDTSHPDSPHGYRQRGVWLLQGDEGELLTDSIAQVIGEYYQGNIETTVIPSFMVGDGNDAFQNTYEIGYTIDHVDFGDCSYAVCNWGAYNAALYAYFQLWGKDEKEIIFVDTKIADSTDDFPTIIRDYDRALSQWLARWVSAPAATMPQKEWHGAWDGYVTDNITINDD